MKKVTWREISALPGTAHVLSFRHPSHKREFSEVLPRATKLAGQDDDDGRKVAEVNRPGNLGGRLV